MNYPQYLEIPKWFEKLGNSLSVWEGVCAVRTRNNLLLYKIVDLELVCLEVPELHGLQITSIGYWTCAEITGRLRNGVHIFYHCDSPEKGYYVLSALMNIHNSRFSRLKIRFDPDPLREENMEWISKRVFEWKTMARELKPNRFKITFDANMPL